MRRRFSSKRIQKALFHGNLDALLVCDLKRPPTGPATLTHPSHKELRNLYSMTPFHLVKHDFVAIASPHPIEKWEISDNRRTLSADITVQDKKMRLIVTYVPHTHYKFLGRRGRYFPRHQPHGEGDTKHSRIDNWWRLQRSASVPKLPPRPTCWTSTERGGQ